MAKTVKINLFSDRVCEARGETIRDAGCIYAAVKDALAGAAQEVMLVASLNQRNRVIQWHMVSLGTLTASLVHPREIYRPAILDAAARIVLVHNHPSSDTRPSPEDLAVTKRLVEVGELVGIAVLDHVIVGDGFYSFAENGQL